MIPAITRISRGETLTCALEIVSGDLTGATCDIDLKAAKNGIAPADDAPALIALDVVWVEHVNAADDTSLPGWIATAWDTDALEPGSYVFDARVVQGGRVIQTEAVKAFVGPRVTVGAATPQGPSGSNVAGDTGGDPNAAIELRWRISTGATSVLAAIVGQPGKSEAVLLAEAAIIPEPTPQALDAYRTAQGEAYLAPVKAEAQAVVDTQVAVQTDINIKHGEAVSAAEEASSDRSLAQDARDDAQLAAAAASAAGRTYTVAEALADAGLIAGKTFILKAPETVNGAPLAAGSVLTKVSGSVVSFTGFTYAAANDVNSLKAKTQDVSADGWAYSEARQSEDGFMMEYVRDDGARVMERLQVNHLEISAALETGPTTYISPERWYYPNARQDEDAYLAWAVDPVTGVEMFALPPSFAGEAATGGGASDSDGKSRARAMSATVDTLPVSTVFDDHPYKVSGVSAAIPPGRVEVQIGAGGELDLSWMHPGAEVLVLAPGGGALYFGTTVFPLTSPATLEIRLTLFGGNAAHDQITMSANSVVAVRRVGNNLIYQAVTGVSTPGTRGSGAVRSRSVLLVGQSNANRIGALGGVGGLETGRLDAAWLQTVDTTSTFYINGATGGSSVPPGNANWWINKDTLEKGPAFLRFEGQLNAALTAGQPLPTRIHWDQGEADDARLQALTMSVTDYKANLVVLFAQIQLSIAAAATAHGLTPPASPIPIEITLVGAQDANAAYLKGASAVRMAYLETIPTVAYLRLGPEKYDLVRQFGQIHLHEGGYYQLGRRTARSHANIYGGQTNNLGPTFAGVVLSDGGRTATLSFAGPGLIFPGLASLFGIVPAGSNPAAGGFTKPSSMSWTADNKLVITAASDMTGAKVLFPTGYGDDPFNGTTWRDRQYPFSSETVGEQLVLLPLRSFITPALA